MEPNARRCLDVRVPPRALFNWSVAVGEGGVGELEWRREGGLREGVEFHGFDAAAPRRCLTLEIGFGFCGGAEDLDLSGGDFVEFSLGGFALGEIFAGELVAELGEAGGEVRGGGGVGGAGGGDEECGGNCGE